jgi:hypothetical protein
VTLVTQGSKNGTEIVFLKMGIIKNGGNWHLEAFLCYSTEKTLCEKYVFLLRQIRQFWCYARFFILYDTEKRCF